MNKKKIFILIFILIFIFITLFLFFYLNNKKDLIIKDKNLDKNLENEEIKNYFVNEKGEKWFLKTEGKFDFNIVSNDEYPKFVKGFIDPLKVSLGDIQRMQVVIYAKEAPKMVWAEIQHDNGYDKVELKLIKEEILTKKIELPIVVDLDGKIVLKNKKEESKFYLILEKFFQKALAENIKEFTYYGEWQVHSTQTKKYYTIFYLKDLNNKQDKMVLAWSDPCSFFNNEIVNNCNLSDVDGLDNDNIKFSRDATVTIQNGGVFVFNPGKYIKLENNGKFVISNSGGAIKEGYLYYQDNDMDGYIKDLSFSQTEKIYIEDKNLPGDEYGRLKQNNNYLIRVYKKDSFSEEISSFPSSSVMTTSISSNLLNNKIFVKNEKKDKNKNLFSFFNIFFNKVNAYLICDPSVDNFIIDGNNNMFYCGHGKNNLPPSIGLVNWFNLNNIYQEDGNLVVSDVLNNTNNSSTKWLKISNFNNFISIPDYALIKDIVVELKASKSNANANVSLIGALFASSSDINGLNVTFEKSILIDSTSTRLYTFSSSTRNLINNENNWSFLPSVKKINTSTSNFGFYLRAKNNSNVTTTVSVDYVKIKIKYEISGVVTTTVSDCDDNDQRVYPNQPNFFPERKDFNCNGVIDFLNGNTISNQSCFSSGFRENFFNKLLSLFINKIFSYINFEYCPGFVPGWSEEWMGSDSCGQNSTYFLGCISCTGTPLSVNLKVYCK